MPLYNSAQAGWNTGTLLGKNVKAIGPGESLVLFDGTETVALSLASVAFARADGSTTADNGCTFKAKTGDVSTVISIQSANEDVDASYGTVGTMLGDGSDGGYTDIGRPAFYRLKITTYTTGAMPVVTVQR